MEGNLIEGNTVISFTEIMHEYQSTLRANNGHTRDPPPFVQPEVPPWCRDSLSAKFAQFWLQLSHRFTGGPALECKWRKYSIGKAKITQFTQFDILLSISVYYIYGYIMTRMTINSEGVDCGLKYTSAVMHSYLYREFRNGPRKANGQE